MQGTIAIIWLSILTGFAFSDIPEDWTVTPADFGNSASVTGVITIAGTESSDANDAISAWVGDECRGFKTNGILFPPTGKTVFGLTIYFNDEDGTDNNITFKAYQASTGQTSEDIVMTLAGTDYSSYAFAINEVAGGSMTPATWSGTLSIDEFAIPNTCNISNIYPNPFNPTTSIEYSLFENGNIELFVYNTQGRKIQTLIDGFQTVGYYSINWNASNYPSGIYFIRMESGESTQIQKVALIK